MNARESENYLAISYSFSASKSVEIFWAEIYRGRLFFRMKAFIRVNILRKFKFIPDRKTLEKIYLTFIRPILEYADVVWDNKTLFLINKLENVQIEAARKHRLEMFVSQM